MADITKENIQTTREVLNQFREGLKNDHERDTGTAESSIQVVLNMLPHRPKEFPGADGDE